MKAFILILCILVSNCSHAGFYKYESGAKIFSQIKLCVDDYHSNKSKDNFEANEKQLLNLSRCIKPFIELEEKYLVKMSWRLTTIDFLSKPYKCSKEIVDDSLKYNEKKPAVSLCIDLKDKGRDRKAIFFFQEIKYKLKFTEIRY
ncbi:MAG: hypothetical protein ACJAS9_000558 [Polaribacter sp.]|jgi:hypothetical protein